MKRLTLLTLLIFGLVACFTVTVMAGSELPKKKQTELGLYVTAKQAYEKYMANPKTVHILDVRTPGEYVFVGHAPMAVNIPIKMFKPGLSADNKLVMPVNENFVAEVEKKFAKSDTLLVMCRSGARSAYAIGKLAKAGFKNAYNITDGFEGGKDKQGKRTVNGWKNSNPWTYQYDAALMYTP